MAARLMSGGGDRAGLPGAVLAGPAPPAGPAWTAARRLAVPLVLVVPLMAGYLVVQGFRTTMTSRYFPWVTGRALGVAGYLALAALVAFGLWMRHPWRYRLLRGHAETWLQAHAALGVGAASLVLGHVLALAADPYAQVGWLGAFVPGFSRYRTVPVALGVAAFELMLLVGATARFAGRWGTRHWLAVHRVATVTFTLSWFHGVLTGTDTHALRPVYFFTGGLVALVLVTRAVAKPVARTHLDLRCATAVHGVAAPQQGETLAGAKQ